MLKRIFASGAIGNILETYDMILITLMATTLASAFFPPTQAGSINITNVLYLYLVGVLARPLGTIFMGSLADRIGRKRVMIISLVVSGLSTAAIGILPTYSQVGIYATILLIILRLCQSFFTGVEYINSATYLIESSHRSTRGYFASWAAIGISGGYLLASLVALIIMGLISSHNLPEWSWRLIFIFSIISVFFGFWLRLAIPESLEFILANANSQRKGGLSVFLSALSFIKNNAVTCLSIAVISFLGCVLSYIYYIYIPINLVVGHSLTHNQALEINVISLTLVVALIPFFGWLSDQFGRVKLMRLVCVAAAILATPFFSLTLSGGFNQALAITLLISIPSSCFFSLYPAIVAEAFPAHIRCTTAALVYQLSVCIEIGTLPFVINHFSKVVGNLYSPVILLLLASATTYFCIGLVKRSTLNTATDNLAVSLQ